MVLRTKGEDRAVSDVADRLTRANRHQFDSLTPLGAVLRRMQALQQERDAARREAAQLRAHLGAMLNSTSWRLTRPVRWAIERLAARRPEPPAPSCAPAPLPDVDVEAEYQQWIEAAESSQVAALHIAPKGFGPAAQPRLALAAMHPAAFAASGLPPGCRVLDLPGEGHADLVARACAAADADFIGFLAAGCTLSSHALTLVADRLAREPELDMVYGDEDWIGPDGRRTRPFLKPGWDPELQRGRDLSGPFVVLRRERLTAVTTPDGPAWLYDLASQVAAQTIPGRIGHIPAVLAHRAELPPGAAEHLRTVALDRLRRSGVASSVVPMDEQPGWQRVIYDLPEPRPLASVIVPTRDRADLLSVCAAGVLEQTDYAPLELLVVDNGSAEPDTLALLDRLARDPRVTVLRDARPFNWSALNNRAAAQASGEVLVLLNNDIAVLRPDWLRELVSHAVQPGMGAVGAKLLYPDGRLQHAGLTGGPAGIPRHIFRHAPGDGFGPYDTGVVARQVWGVTGACMAVPRAAFAAVGGLNEALPVACNDVDFCLRLTARGYRIVWTPWAVLEHRELASRAPDHADERRSLAAEEMNRLWRDWGALLQYDPFLNPNLQLVGDRPSLLVPPQSGP